MRHVYIDIIHKCNSARLPIDLPENCRLFHTVEQLKRYSGLTFDRTSAMPETPAQLLRAEAILSPSRNTTVFPFFENIHDSGKNEGNAENKEITSSSVKQTKKNISQEENSDIIIHREKFPRKGKGLNILEELINDKKREEKELPKSSCHDLKEKLRELGYDNVADHLEYKKGKILLTIPYGNISII